MKTKFPRKKFWYVIFVIIILILLAIGYCKNLYPQITGPQICFTDHCFSVQIADTPATRSKGLMYMTGMDQNKGMLFVFQQKSNYSFWMKNTLIPLDIIWMDENYKVVFISSNTPPCIQDPCASYNPGKVALYVLELNGGSAKKIGLKIGDQGNYKE